MKTKRFSKLCAALTSILMLSGIAAALPVSAAEELLGDLDGDGVLTGHDTAMLSRYLYADSTLLTEEQLQLADFNEDGTVDAADAIALHQAETYCIGDADLDGTLSTLDGLYALIQLQRNLQFYISEEKYPIASQVQQNLMDADGDGILTGYDTVQILSAYANFIAACTNDIECIYNFCEAEGCYYLHRENARGSSAIDLDGDGVLTDHDAVLIEYMNRTKISNSTVLIIGDINNDGKYDSQDTDYIHQNASYTFENSGITAELALQLASYQMAGGTVKITTSTEGEEILIKRTTSEIYQISDTNYNLMDVDGDSEITTADVYGLLQAYSRQQAGGSFYPEDGYSLA